MSRSTAMSRALAAVTIFTASFAGALPADRAACLALQASHGIRPGVSWGGAAVDVRRDWAARRCDGLVSRRPGPGRRRIPNRAAACANKTSPDGPRKPIFFVHLHKAGGTTFLTLARRNGYCAPVSEDRRDAASFFAKNGNPSMAHARRAIWGPAAEMAAYAREKRLDVWATEWFVPTALPGPGVVSVVVVRDPVRLAFSHCLSTPETVAKAAACARRPERVNSITARLAACEPGWRGAGGVARYRDLPACEATPEPHHFLRRGFPPWGDGPEGRDYGALAGLFNSTALLAAAKRRLDAIDVVLVTERLADAGPVLSRELGWAVTDATAHRAGTNKGDVIAGNAALAAELRTLNYNDVRVHAHAQERFAGLLRRATGGRR